MWLGGLVKDLPCDLDWAVFCLDLQWGVFVACDLEVYVGLDYLLGFFNVVYDLEAKLIVGKEQVPVQKFVDGLVVET